MLSLTQLNNKAEKSGSCFDCYGAIILKRSGQFLAAHLTKKILFSKMKRAEKLENFQKSPVNSLEIIFF